MDALAEVEALAASLEPSLRARALALRVRGPNGLDWGPRGLYDPEPYVQIATIDALAEVDGGLALLDPWVAQARDPYAQAAGAVVLGDHASDAVRTRLTEALATAPSWARAPVALAGTAVGVDGALDVLLAELRRGEIALELRFVADLARVGHTEALRDAMAEGAERIEPELAADWSSARLALDDPAAAAAARDGLSDPRTEGRMEVLDALARVPGDTAVPVLRKARAAGPEVVRDYATCLLVARHALSPRQLVPLASSEVDEIRALAMGCAADSGDSALVERVLLVGLADEAATVRLAAARAAQDVGTAAHAPFLRTLAREEDLGVRLEAAGALMRQRD